MGRAIANQPLANPATRIRELRIARGWSQDELAARLIDPETGKPLTRQTAQRWEAGDRALTLDKLEIAAKAFGVPRSQLLPEGDGLTDQEHETLTWLRSLSAEEADFVGWFRAASPEERMPLLALKRGLFSGRADQAAVRTTK